MKLTFGTYEHTTIGFHKVVLKWTVENGKVVNVYQTIEGVINPWSFYHQYPLPFIADECMRFDNYVRKTFGHDPAPVT